MNNTTQSDDRNLFNYESPQTKLTYSIKRIISLKHGLKVELAVYMKGKKIISDTPNLSSAKKRMEVAKQCASISKRGIDIIKQDLFILQEEFNKAQAQRNNQNKKDKLKISEKDREAALRLLRQDNLIENIQTDIKNMGVVGEETNVFMVYLIATSRLLDAPLSAILKGNSASGKSYLVNTVLQLFPDSEVLTYSYLSSKAMAYMKSDALKHKVLCIFERPGAEASDYNIRIMLSERVIRIGTVGKDEDTKRNKTQDMKVEGPIAYLETTTKSFIHPENETRLFSLYIDESSSQTLRIHENQRQKYRIEDDLCLLKRQNIKLKHYALQELLKPYVVKIPYVDYIKFPFHKLRSRRDYAKFLSLIEVITFLHQYQRKQELREGVRYLMAAPKDYEIAYNFAKDILISNLSAIPPKSRQLFEQIFDFKMGFTRSDINKKTNWGLYEIERYLRPLIDEGYIEVLSGSKGQIYRYRIIKRDLRDDLAMDDFLHPSDLYRIYEENKKRMGDIMDDLT